MKDDNNNDIAASITNKKKWDPFFFHIHLKLVVIGLVVKIA